MSNVLFDNERLIISSFSKNHLADSCYKDLRMKSTNIYFEIGLLT